VQEDFTLFDRQGMPYELRAEIADCNG